MKSIKYCLIFSLFLFFLISCSSTEPTEPEIVEYLHLGHTRTESNPLMDPIVEQIDFTKYNMLWLGGDIAYSTSYDEQTITHVDSIYNLGNANTLLALGNHDYNDLKRVERFTNRPAFYCTHKNGITFIILDTQDSLTNIIGKQKELFESVIDTLEHSTHLVILTHKLIWMYDNSYLQPQINTISNGSYGDCFYCINPNNFYSDIYPKLLEVKRKGIAIICVGGDIGNKVKEFEFVTDDDIYFLASGIQSGVGSNKGLVFTHDITNKTLDWEFKFLEEL